MMLNKGEHPVEQTLPLLEHLPSWLCGVSHSCDVTMEGRSVTRMFSSRVCLSTVCPGSLYVHTQGMQAPSELLACSTSFGMRTAAGLGTAQVQPLPVLPLPSPAAQSCGFHRSLSWTSTLIEGNTLRKFLFLP